MEIKRYVSRASNIFAENRLAKLIIICLVFMNIIQFIYINAAFKEQRIVLIPAGLTKKVEISGNYLDQNYLEAMGIYISQLLYNFTYDNVEQQYKELETLFTPESHAKYSESLNKIAKQYRKNKITMNFLFKNIKVSIAPDQEIVVGGTVKKYILNEIESEKKINLIIKYRIDKGLFSIVDIEEVKQWKNAKYYLSY